MSKAAAATWVCPICGRRVPRRETECFCGAKQQQAEQHQRKEEQKKSARIPLDVAMLVVLAVLIGVYALHRVTQQVSDDSSAGARNILGPALATPEPGPRRSLPVAPSRAPQQAATPPVEQPAFQRAPPPPLPPPGAAPPVEAPRAATPTPAPTPFDERAQVRAAGLAAFEAELQRLAASAARLQEHVRAYRAECGEAQRFGGVSNCAEIESTVQRESSRIQQALDAAEDQARRAWLEPGQVRDARGRTVFGSRQWDETLSAARNLKR